MRNFYIRVRTKEQLDAVLGWDNDFVLLAEYELMDLVSGLEELPAAEIYYCLPDIARQERISSIEQMVKSCPEQTGLVVRNLDELGMLKALNFHGPVMADAFLYAYNSEAVRFYREIFSGMNFILSDELTDAELARTAELSKTAGPIRTAEAAAGCTISAPADLIYKIYGHQQLMITNQCISRNYTGCREKCILFNDDRGNDFYAVSRCSQCYSVIYSGQPVSMLDKADEVRYENLLLDFTVENRRQTEEILTMAADIRDHGANVHKSLQDKTADGRKMSGSAGRNGENRGFARGHHYRGVD